MKTTYLDPDYRVEPTTDFYCIRCQKSLKGRKRRWIVLDDPAYGVTVIHPQDAPEGAERFPVGMDCAKQIGIEFTSE